MISVIIPLYNKEQQIANTLRTVLNQTFQNFEIIIVDDGSTDNSVIEAEKVQDSRIRIIHQKNAGVSAARNKGIEEARYNLIAFLDADDEWKSQYLEIQYNLYLKYPECSVYAVNYEFRDSKGKITPTKINKLPFTEEDGVLSNYFKVSSCSHPPLWTSAVVVRKEAIESIGKFPNGVRSGEDLLTWARLYVKYNIVYSKLCMAIYHVENDSIIDVPKRLPAQNDIVGKELIKLLKENKNIGLKNYISHWYKMRASIYMRLNMKDNCIIESIKSLKYNILNYKVLIYIILVVLPLQIRLRILKNK